ncbi:hypothetical protein FHS56_001230 [Thermonema lapsum]|uniref:DUF5916 domain-containing protein n=1 Tax=Thermonema lapsum TaxID=28195 RepID=A0A846MR28_9BACT|nr:DUF5916 domain-containing protein [Thermonema lapsum]NIK73717.1 hypothetical protein [Thermonema lapsum]
MMFLRFFTLCVAICAVSCSIGQAQSQYELLVRKIPSGSVKIDGQLNEEVWAQALVANHFWQNFPYDSSAAQSQTEVRMLFDEQNIYIAAVCHGQSPEEVVVSSLRRDFSPSNNDFFMVVFDTFQDGTNGFLFGVNPYGVQREGLIADGGNRGADEAWDNKWFAEVCRHADHWTVEMAIPFKSIRFKNGSNEWKANFLRGNLAQFERSTWVPVPRNFFIVSLAYTGTLHFEQPLQKPKSNVVVIPYLTGSYAEDFTQDTTKAVYKGNAGADFKVVLSSSLNLDLTFNPDFSQVEVDRQVTNLDRFEIFFPERRQFFLENADLFANFGFSRIRPFFSRRIGIARDTTTGLIVQTPILYGARLSGKVNRDWRVGLLNMQTSPDDSRGITGKNYTVAAVQRRVFSRSNIAAVFVNEQTTSTANKDFTFNTNNYNRVVGLDYNLASEDNTWQGKFFYHQLFTPENLPAQFAHAAYLAYDKPTFLVAWNHEWVGENYAPSTGYVPRNGHFRLEPFARYTIFPKGSKHIARHNIFFYNSFYWDNRGTSTDRFSQLRYEAVFQNTAGINLAVRHNYVLLFFSFDPTNTGGPKLPEGSEYTNYSAAFSFNTDRRKLFNLDGDINYGQYYNGHLLGISGSVNYRFQPFGSISLSGNYIRILLPQPYHSAELILLGPRIDLSFSRELFLTTFLQYNNQIDNVNINARLQWRFKPVSDIFVVYTDNYFAHELQQKNRALVIKATYWLNI